MYAGLRPGAEGSGRGQAAGAGDGAGLAAAWPAARDGGTPPPVPATRHPDPGAAVRALAGLLAARGQGRVHGAWDRRTGLAVVSVPGPGVTVWLDCRAGRVRWVQAGAEVVLPLDSLDVAAARIAAGSPAGLLARVRDGLARL